MLREVRESDLPILFEQQLDPEATQMAAFPARDRQAFMEHWARILIDESLITRAIVFDGQVAGNIGSFESAGHWQVAYWIGKQYWGRGIATRALSEFMRDVTERPLYAHVAKHNTASIRVLQKCGFTICGEERGDDQIEEFILRLDRQVEPS